MQKKKQDFDSGSGAIYRTDYSFEKKRIKEINSKSNVEKCPRCGEIMIQIQTCHFFCENCGGHLDCSDI